MSINIYTCDDCNFNFSSENSESVHKAIKQHQIDGCYVNIFKDIKEFHTKFELFPKIDCPHLLSEDLQKFRKDFLYEELTEFNQAYFNRDLEGCFDALIDLIYVAAGTMYLMGLPSDKGWQEVHKCNLNKIRAKHKTESKRGHSSDVIKPKDWQAPNLKKLL